MHGGRRPGAGRPRGSRNGDRAAVSALHSLRESGLSSHPGGVADVRARRQSLPPDLQQKVRVIEERLEDVLMERVSPSAASAVIKAAALMLDNILAPHSRSVEVSGKVGIEALVLAAIAPASGSSVMAAHAGTTLTTVDAAASLPPVSASPAGLDLGHGLEGHGLALDPQPSLLRREEVPAEEVGGGGHPPNRPRQPPPGPLLPNPNQVQVSLPRPGYVVRKKVSKRVAEALGPELVAKAEEAGREQDHGTRAADEGQGGSLGEAGVPGRGGWVVAGALGEAADPPSGASVGEGGGA